MSHVRESSQHVLMKWVTDQGRGRGGGRREGGGGGWVGVESVHDRVHMTVNQQVTNANKWE